MDINSPKLSALPRPVERAVIFDDVRFSYDDERDVLRGISAWLDMREYTVVLGENGSGKSTLAKHINALLIPDSGSVHVRGSDTSHERCTLEVRRNCAMVFQNPDNQMVANTVRDDVAFGPENLGLNREAIIERVDQALAEVALEAFAERDPNSLSGGEKQRVAIAGVLALRPELIVFDEPGAMLDPRGRRGIRRVMRELNDAGIGVVHITHFMDEALAADKVIVMKEGKIALSGTPTEVFAYGDDIRSLGLEEPFAMQLAQALQGRGVPVPDTGNMEDIIETLYAGGCVDESAVHSVTAEADCSSDKRFVCGVRERRHGQYEPEHNSFSIFGRNEKNTFGHASENIAALGLKNTAEQGITNAAAHDAKSLVGEIEFRGVTFAADPKAVKLLRRAPETASREHGAILAGIDLRIAAGEFCCIVGHTGSGKSTLVEQIKGLHAPTAGEILIDGEIAGSRGSETRA
ncbi:energy-coupling factor transporter ATPase [Arcanobacterium hippocoleae]